jgi:hypothetical protein
MQIFGEKPIHFSIFNLIFAICNGVYLILQKAKLLPIPLFFCKGGGKKMLPLTGTPELNMNRRRRKISRGMGNE